MFHVVLYRPEIPPNTGNIIRLCANTGCALHLVGRLGFTLDERRLRRAGLDYHEWVRVRHHRSLAEFWRCALATRLVAFTTAGAHRFDEWRYRPGDALLFGSESRGLPAPMLARLPPSQRLRVPMQPGNRSLNLSNTVAVACYEAWRQQGFSCTAE